MTSTGRARLGRQWSLGLLIVIALATAACTQTTPYRTVTLAHAATSPNVTVQEINCSVGPDRRFPQCESQGDEKSSAPAFGEYAIQRRHYAYRQKDRTELKPAAYHMAFVEFDDQGWFADRKQMEALFMVLTRYEQQKEHPLIMVYAHGWKHDASQCDGNVICFSRLLERLDVLERQLPMDEPAPNSPPSPGCSEAKLPARPIIGVYVGWRGLSLKVAKNATFWTRKATAERVGRGGVKELLTRLNNYRDVRNPTRCDGQTQLVIAGHSFGGLVVYQALSHVLMDRAGDVRHFKTERCSDLPHGHQEKPPYGPLCYNVAKSFGDFVLLVNPAFEGTLYEPLFHLATNRCYPAWQRPIMMTVTSSGDDATGIAFPFGRTLSTLFEHRKNDEQVASMLNTVGHAKRYQTHQLEWTGSKAETAGTETVSRGKCDCTQLEATDKFKWWEFARDLQAQVRPWISKAPRADDPDRIKADTTDGTRVYRVYGKDVVLVGDPKYSVNYPYLVVTASPEIIPDHNSIYTEPFIRFLHSFFLVHIASRHTFEGDACFTNFQACTPGGMMPCEQSCQLAGGESCSGRRINDIPNSRR